MQPSKRVFIASIATETNTFSPMRTDLQDFHDSFYAPPGTHPATPTLCSAVYTAARAGAVELGWEIIEGTASWAEPGGVVNQSTWDFLRDQLLEELAAAGPVDIVLLGLHGAMVAQDTIDCEGELLALVRAQVATNAIIGVTFDPHSHLSHRRVENADLITVFKEFPHTDFVETAEDLVRLAAAAAAGETRPEISTFDCRMIEIFPTSREPMRGFVDRVRRMEGKGDVLSISVIHGFMAGDVPDLGAKVIVITDGAKRAGDAMAARLGKELFGLRGRTRPEFLGLDEGLDRACAAKAGPVVIADVWDNPGGGVPGDSTTLLRAMLARGMDNVALASIWDPIAVRTCFSAGEGACLRLRFGAKMAEGCGEPLDADVIVRRTRRSAVQSFGASIVPIGDAAWIEVGGIDVILNSVRSQVFSPDIFSNMGIDPEKKSVLAVKSTNHFHGAFAPMAADILYLSIDGPYPNDPATNRYTRLTRDIWPKVKNPHET